MPEPLTLSDLAVGYFRRNKENILHSDINVCLEEGEFVCLLGPNGAGKSTLLKTIAGFIPKISGKVMILGNDLDSMSERTRAKHISIVLTERPVIADMTVSELVSLGRNPFTGFFGQTGGKDKLMVKKAICDVGLKGFENIFISRLSDGERQKAFIAKSLVQETPLILLDEPTAFLDLPSRVEIMHLLKELAHEHHKSVLLSTHDLDLALQTADKIWLLATGLPLKTGIPEDLVLANEFKKFFEREGILFDNYTGQFTLNRENAKPIRLIGTGIEYKWISCALLRNGFVISDNPSEKVQFEIDNKENGGYIVSGINKAPVNLHSIKELLDYIK